MTVSNFANKRNILRYLSNPNFLSSFISIFFYPSISPHTLLNPCLTLTPVLYTLFPSYTIRKNHSFHNSSSGSPSDSSFAPPSTQYSCSFPINEYNHLSNKYPISGISFLGPHCVDLFRWFSTSSSDGYLSKTPLENLISDKNRGFEKMGVACFENSEFRERTVDVFDCQKQVSKIIEVIISSGNDIKVKLNSMDLNLSDELISEIFRVLNCHRTSALDFFHWVRYANPSSYWNSDVCSLIIDNCGWLDDYETMVSLLTEFNSKKIYLNEKAFGFLPILVSSKASIRESIRRLTDMLNGVGGSSRGSGIRGLIKMLCGLDSFEMAKFVIEITTRKVSYYNILICAKCRNGHFEEARGLIKEMRELGCHPNAKTYNYLLSYLCKYNRTAEACSVLEEMQEKGSPPNSLSFEIFIYFACRLGKVDIAHQFLNRMVSRGLEPRLTTHAAFVKGYFYARQYEEAYKYVVDSSFKYVHSTNMIYSLLASLHHTKGDLMVACNILIELMEKGLKPNFSVYMRTRKRLQKTGRGHLARDLERRFSRFRLESSEITG